LKKSKEIRVVIVDDHPVVREGLAALINRRADMKVVGEAASGDDAIRQFQAHRPDVILMDLRMPGMDGVETIREIRRQSPEARIIILTTFDGDEDIYRGLRAGAKAYLLKDTPREQLLDCIRAVNEGRMWIPTSVASKLAGRLGGPDLTEREKDVLRLMALGKSNKEIGAQLCIAEGTVKLHVNHVLRKLSVGGRTEAVTTALERGLVHIPAKSASR
jgi:DNA-binding NarL/FixJ family response regulator